MNEKGAWGVVEATIKGGVSLLPLGSFLIEYYNLAKENVANERFKEWKTLVETRLSKMQCDIEELSRNKFFFSFFQIASASALKCHQKEKMEMFAAALFNSLEFPNLADDKKLFFMTLLDKYTLNTLRLLHFLSKKRKYEKTVNGITSPLARDTEHPFIYLCQYFPELEKDKSYLLSITNQLVADGLLYQFSWSVANSPEIVRNKKTTDMGDEFLAFIEAGNLE